MLLQAKAIPVVLGKPARLTRSPRLFNWEAQQSRNAQRGGHQPPLVMSATWSVHLALKVTNRISERNASHGLIEHCECQEGHRVVA